MFINTDQSEESYRQGNPQADLPQYPPVQKEQNQLPADVYFQAGNSQPPDINIYPPPAYSANTYPQDISTKGTTGKAQDAYTQGVYPEEHPQFGSPYVQQLPVQPGNDSVVSEFNLAFSVDDIRYHKANI